MAGSMEPSKKDMKLLFELDFNYRQPYSRIGRKIRMSQQLISYKVKTFTDEGLIIGAYPLIDYARLGYMSFRVYFKINYVNREKFQEMLDHMAKHPNITTIIECDGRYDLMCVFTARNPSSFNKKLRELVAAHPQHLKNFIILTTVVEHHYSRNYLGVTERSDSIIGGDRELIKLDEKDKKLLRAVHEGRKGIVEMARAADIAPQTAITKLKELEKALVVKGYRLHVNPRKIGFARNRMLIRLQDISVQRENELRDFCKQHQNITEFIKTFGAWDLEIMMETRTREEFRNLYITIREKFQDIIDDFDNFRIFRVHKKSTMPEEFFQQEAKPREKAPPKASPG